MPKKEMADKETYRTPDAFRCFDFLHDMTCDCIATDIQGDLDNIQR